MQTETVPIESISTDPANARSHGERNLEAIRDSLRAFGQQKPIVVDGRGIVIAGNGTLEAAKRLGWTEIAIVRTELDPGQATAFGIADNRTAELAEWNDEVLRSLLDTMDDEMLDVLAFDSKEIDAMVPPVAVEVQEDEIPEEVEPRTKPGDLWLLGRHRLLCGDSTNPQHVERLMDGKKADMVFTDPPYGMHLNADYSSAKGDPEMNKRKSLSGGNKYKQVIGDHDDFTPELINTVFACFPDCQEVFLWGADYYAELLPNKNDGSWVVWDKRLEESTDTMYGSCFELCWSKSKHKRDIARIKWAAVFGTEQEHDKCRSHPTQKPTALAEWFFERWGNAGDMVADLYGGSGSTLIACEKTRRHACLMELDPAYCDVIVRRWENLTGEEATR